MIKIKLPKKKQKILLNLIKINLVNLFKFLINLKPSLKPMLNKIKLFKKLSQNSISRKKKISCALKMKTVKTRK